MAKLKSWGAGQLQHQRILHELYFPDGIGEAPTEPSGLLAQAMSRDFSSLDRWKAEFRATRPGQLSDGDGWVILFPLSARQAPVLITAPPASRRCRPAARRCWRWTCTATPTRRDYGSDAVKYIEAFVQAIKWTNAERLYREAMRL